MDVVYKTHENQPAPAAEAHDPWKGWNDWADSKIEAALTRYDESVGEAIAHFKHELRKELQPEIHSLRAEVATLTAKLDAARSDVARLQGRVDEQRGREHARRLVLP